MRINPLPSTSPFFPFSNSLLNSPPPHLQSLRSMGNGAEISSLHIVSSSSAGGLLTLILCCSVGTLSWDTVLHEPLQHKSFLQAVVHKLLYWVHKRFHRMQSFRNSLLQDEFSQTHRFCQNPAAGWASHGS